MSLRPETAFLEVKPGCFYVNFGLKIESAFCSFKELRVCGMKQPCTFILEGSVCHSFLLAGKFFKWTCRKRSSLHPGCSAEKFACPTKHFKPRGACSDHHPWQEPHLRGVQPRWINSVAYASGQQNLLPGSRGDEVADVPSLVLQQVCPGHLYKERSICSPAMSTGACL